MHDDARIMTMPLRFLTCSLQGCSVFNTKPISAVVSAVYCAQELAWTSFALLKNVNCCSVLLLQPDTNSALMARGAVAQSVAVQGDAAASLNNISQVGGSHLFEWSAYRLSQKCTCGVLQKTSWCTYACRTECCMQATASRVLCWYRYINIPCLCPAVL
jgi:hypothetical protein